MQSQTNRNAALVAAIMAGGRSRRMGRDKAALALGGIPMLERVALAAHGAGMAVIVVGRERPEWWTLEGVRFIDDDAPDTGPLGGIATALRVAGAAVLALACDMPLVTTEAIAWLQAEAAKREICDGLVTQSGSESEPLFAIYMPSCGLLIDELLARGEYSVRRLLDRAAIDLVGLPPEFASVATNVNTLADLDAIAKGRGEDISSGRRSS